MSEIDQIGREIDATHVLGDDECVIYDEENSSAHVQSDAFLPLDEVE